MSGSLAREDVGRAVVEETRRVIDYHNARVYLLEPPDTLVPVAFEGRVGAYEKVDLDILRTTVGTGFTGWVAQHRVPLKVDDALADPRGSTIPGTDAVEESMLVVPMLHDDEAQVVIDYGMGMPAEEAAAFQTMGFFERQLELAGAVDVRGNFAQRSWAGDPRTLLELRWRMPGA